MDSISFDKPVYPTLQIGLSILTIVALYLIHRLLPRHRAIDVIGAFLYVPVLFFCLAWIWGGQFAISPSGYTIIESTLSRGWTFQILGIGRQNMCLLEHCGTPENFRYMILGNDELAVPFVIGTSLLIIRILPYVLPKR